MSKRSEARAASHALGWLITWRKDVLGLTWDDIRDRGGFSSHTIAYNLAYKDLQQTPRRSTLVRLAAALDVPEDVVKVCAASAVGFVDFDDELRREVEKRVILHIAEGLPPQDQKRLAQVAAVMVGWNYPPTTPGNVDI